MKTGSSNDVQHAANAAEVVAAEREHIERARKEIGITDPVRELPPSALCMSGGGIRSASFSIGFLQGLAEQRLIRRFDYLSGVSGGGYALGWWTALLKRNTFKGSLKEGLEKSEALISNFFAEGITNPPQDPFVRRYVRAHGNYLTVRTGLASPDTWAAIVTIARNLTYGLGGPGLAMVFAGLALLVVAGALMAAPFTYGSWVAILAGAVAAAGWGMTASIVHGSNDGAAQHRRQWAAPWLLALGCALHVAFLVAPYPESHLIGGQTAEQTARASIWIMLAGDIVIMGMHLRRQGTKTQRFSRIFPSTVATLALVCGAVLLMHSSPLYTSWSLGGGISIEDLIQQEPHRTWLLWSLLMLSHAWEWMRALCLLQRGRLVSEGAANLGESRAARFRSAVADFASVLCGAALVGVLPLLIIQDNPAAGNNSDGWAYAGFLTLILSVIAVLYSSVVTVSLGAQRVHKKDGPYGKGFAEAMEREVWSQLWSQFLLTSFLLVTALTVARAVNTLTYIEIQRATLIAMPLLVLLAAAGLLSSNGQFAKLFLRACGFAAVFLTALLALLMARLLLIRVPEAFGAIASAFVFAGLATVLLIILWRSGPNTFSMHELYRHRLVRALLGASHEEGVVARSGFCQDDDLLLSDLLVASESKTALRPFPVWCAAVNVTASGEVGLQDRKAASFIFTPLYCGYEVAKAIRAPSGATAGRAYAATGAHGYHDEHQVDKSGKQHESEPLTLGAAMATSGAAFSSNTGASTQPERALLLTLLGFRLGRWFPNPASMATSRGAKQPVPKNAWTVGVPIYNDEELVELQLPHIIREALSQCDVKANAVYVTDGGHFENLAVYEMIRRRAMLIVAVDAGFDPEFEFEDLMNLQQKVRADFGAEIVVADLASLRISKTKFAEKHVAVWDVVYQPRSPSNSAIIGKFIYCKSTLTGTEPADLLAYRKKVPSFPHLSTINQWFAESTFEAYRTLGLVVGREAAKVLSELSEMTDRNIHQKVGH